MSRLADKVHVEPLEDERLANLERRIVARAGEASARRELGSWRPLAFAGLAAALATSAVVGWKLRGQPTVIAAGETTLAVTTGAEHSTLALDDMTIDSGPGSQLAITRGEHRVVVALTKGRVELAVAHREDRIVLVRAGDTEIEDVGTTFAVEYTGADAGGRVDVRVAQGEVKVTRGQRAVTVAAGSGWTSEGEHLVAAAELDATHTFAGQSKPDQLAAASRTVSGLPARSDSTTSAATTASAAAATMATTTTMTTTTIALRDHRTTVPAATERAPRVTQIAVASDPYVDLKLAIKQQRIEFDPNIDGLRDAGSEIARLKKVAYSPTTLGADASQALYRIAVLLHKPLKQNSEALRTLDVYRRRFAGGSEMHAAEWLRVRIACERAIDDECREAAYTYQHEVPVGSAADVAIRITNAQ